MLINGEHSVGVTALFATEEYDQGDLIMQRSITLQYPIKISDAIGLISPIYSEIVNDIFKGLQSGNLPRHPQQHADATYSLWLDEKDYFIDWGWPANKIARFVDAVGFPFNGAKAMLNGKSINIFDAEEVHDMRVENRHRHIGKVIFMREMKPIIVCGEGMLKVNTITDDDGTPMMIKFRSRLE